MTITACPRCGSKNIDIAGIRDYGIPQMYWQKVCRDCEWQGTPLIFENETDYNKFLNSLNKNVKKEEKVYYKDPAESAPIRRYILREFATIFLASLLVIIPGLVYVLVSVYGNFSKEIGFLFALLSFAVYLYIVWKKQLWNMIKR
jgi:hypothetical protein